MKTALTLAALAILGLSACEAPTQQGMTISPEAMARADTLSADVIVPRVNARDAITVFDAFCGRFAGNPAGTRRAVEANGYFLFVSGTAQGLQMYATDDGRPVVATGRQDGAEVCMVLMAENPNLGREAARYITAKHGDTAMSVGSMQVGAETAENVFIIPTNPPLIYFTLVQDQPGLGRVEAFAQVTE